MSNRYVFPEPHFIETNKIHMAVREMGSGPAVILLHGFPEFSYSWRHQLPALANAGYRAIAPDLRGYGQTDKPPDVSDYRQVELIRDVVGLFDALDLETAVLIGHDWGALLAWQIALSHADRLSQLITLNIPFMPRSSTEPIVSMRRLLGDDFYIVNFQDSDDADRRCSADPGRVFDVMMRRNQIRRRQFEQLPPSMQRFSLLRALERSESAGEPLLNDEERELYVEAFSNDGFRGPINWYRNWTQNWQDTVDVEQKVSVPTLFIGAVDDVIVSPAQIDAMNPFVSDLTIKLLEPCGHWTQQERPDDVNQLILDWLVQRR